MFINFSTMDLQRNIEMEFDPTRNRFESAAPGWSKQPSILRANSSSVKLEFFKYWHQRVVSLGFPYNEVMPLVYNEQGLGIYRMVFFARHALPNRIWGEIGRNHNPTLELPF
ncbi:MAG: hypothetical protein ACREUT_01305 [Steroidobacteraceae bacterium]